MHKSLKALSVSLLAFTVGCQSSAPAPIPAPPGCDERPDYTSTFSAIQGVIFKGYHCTNSLCHGGTPPSGNLDLTPPNAYLNLINTPSTSSALSRVLPGNHSLSFLYQRLEDGSMPAGGGQPLTAAHLAAMHLWIDAGAPETGVVTGTEPLLSSCPSTVKPNKIPAPEAPGAGIGVQIQSSAWPLNAQSEDQICFASYYDFTKTKLIPASEQITCPNGMRGANNPSDKCFRYHRQVLHQDPLSHHAINKLYNGAYDISDFGPFTYKTNDLSDTKNGQVCDPTDVDATTGRNQDCSGIIRSLAGCRGYGPPDFNRQITRLTVAQTPLTDQTFASGVYRLLPMSGIVVWNSHAFNLSQFDATMAQYMNLYLSGPSDKRHPVKDIFKTAFIYSPNIAPFSTQEICTTVTLPQGANLFELTSHTHQWGVQFRIWEPPNAPCVPSTCVAGPDSRLIYISTDYSDPLQLALSPPVTLNSPAPKDRSYLYCALYDNGSTPSSPAVKQRSTSATPLPNAAGGACGNATVACMAGPNKGQLCNGSNAFCDSALDAGDGICDACPVVGGTTSTDEMFIPIGSYY